MDTRRTLLFVLNSLDVGGSESKIIKIANALVTDCRIEIAYLNSPDTLLEKINPAVQITHLNRSGKYSIGALRRLRKLIGRRAPVVLAVNLYPLLYAVPAVKGLSSSATVIALINTAQMEDRVHSNRHLRLYCAVLRRCDRIVFGCKSQMSTWTENYRLPRKRCDFIYNGVDGNFFFPQTNSDALARLRRDYGIPSESFLIGCIARLSPEKGLDLLISAIANLKALGRPSFLAMAGEGPDKQRLEGLAVQLGVSDKVKFLGRLDDVRPAISALDVFVLPSISVETFSNAALEAMAMAKPVILSDVGGATEMIEHEKNGMIFKVGDVAALTEMLTTLYDSAAIRRNLGTAARQRVIDAFEFSSMVAKYREFSQNTCP